MNVTVVLVMRPKIGDTEWTESLMNSIGQIPGAFDKELQAQLLVINDTTANKLFSNMAGLGKNRLGSAELFVSRLNM